ncbi:MAG: hypothetical protein A2Y77_00800 [Planctomycetes bacterium RBG_13_62_9]|nr:MAG: hypothetical protein A2Y77_00800 [Planctomycetes bacterium RBG_13_62_9]
MEYEGKYKVFDLGRIRTYPLSKRSNKVALSDLVFPKDLGALSLDLPQDVQDDIRTVAQAVVAARREGSPVLLFTGAHLIKNGLGPLLVDLVERGCLTLVAGNGATAIHDFELALIGETSENVPAALDKGQFGMAYEFAYINMALAVGNQQKLGCGESLGRMICDEKFRGSILALAAREDSVSQFRYPEVSVLAACYRRGIPFTIHAGIGTDVIDQHPSFDGQAKGGCSGRDLLIYTNEVAKLTEGGVVLNVGSAVTGPEVLLKAISMAANVGSVPQGILTADFDLREHEPRQMTDESAQGYYFRDQKSVVTRIPQAFDGRGLYIQGDQKQTFPFLCKRIIEAL